MKKARLKHRPSYQLRHTFASYCLQQGCDPAWVGRMLGHSTLQTTFKHYARFIDDASKANERKLDQSIAESGPLFKANSKNPKSAYFCKRWYQNWYHEAENGVPEKDASAPVSLSEYEKAKWWRRRESHSRPKKTRNKALQV